MAASAWLGAGRTAWLREVEVWVGTSVDSFELESVKERPWGAVLRVVTPGASVYFKAAGPLGRHEPVIISDLAARWPDLAPDLLAVDFDRAWMLLADHGVPMGDTLPAAQQVAVLERLLPQYAEMQLSTTDLVPRWLAGRAMDRRVDHLPALFDELLGGRSPIGTLPIDERDRTRYLADLPLLSTVCAELATTRAADALDHADLHGTNVLVDGTGARVIDWGDSCITHPFSSLAVPYELAVAELPAPDRPSATVRLRDAYLEPWGPTPDDLRMFGQAVWVALVTRAVNVAHETLGAPGDHGEIATLLRTWHARRALLNRPVDILQPT